MKFLKLAKLVQLVLYHLNLHIPIYLRLATQAVRVFRHSHVFFAVVSRAQLLHPLFHMAHAGGAESVASACMFHGNAVIQRDLEERLAVFGLDGLYLAGVVEGDPWQYENYELRIKN